MFFRPCKAMYSQVWGLRYRHLGGGGSILPGTDTLLICFLYWFQCFLSNEQQIWYFSQCPHNTVIVINELSNNSGTYLLLWFKNSLFTLINDLFVNWTHFPLDVPHLIKTRCVRCAKMTQYARMNKTCDLEVISMCSPAPNLFPINSI